MKFNIEVYLVVATVDKDKNQTKFLLLNDSFPSEPLEKKNTTRDVAIRLLSEYTGVTQDWAVILPFGVVDDVDPEKETVAILYGVFIPDVTRTKKAGTAWRDYNEIVADSNVSEFTKKLAYEAVWRSI